MIISEKQVMQLLDCTRACYEFMLQTDNKNTAEKIKELVNKITNQQSDELKVIE